jgi:hypothetical protein
MILAFRLRVQHADIILFDDQVLLSQERAAVAGASQQGRRRSRPTTPWAQSPDKVTKPRTEEAIMGSFYPRGEYTDKATFEANGPK